MRVLFEPMHIVQDALAGQNLLEIAEQVGVAIERVCGGRGTCARCRVIVQGAVSPLTPAEERGLTPQERDQGYRLACQTNILGDVHVTVPPESRIAQVSILASGIDNPIVVEPWVERHLLTIPPASLEEPVADANNIQCVWEQANLGSFELSLAAMRQIPETLRAQQGDVVLIKVDDEIVRIAPVGARTERLLGMAFDVGSTTVVGYLLDLETGEQLAIASELNPQTRYGDDVVSRIQFAGEPGGIETLQQEIIAALNRIIIQATAQGQAEPEDIVAVTVVGNTTMQHLLLGIKPTYLAQAPYVPVFTRAQCIKASDLGLSIYSDAHVWLLPNIAGWVGADTVGVLLATGIHQEEHIALAIDIGTNGEMALGSRERLITCSTAAGPAFEGAHISCGMRAAAGAIDAIEIDHDVIWHTIGESEPLGVCGSGLVDAVAELLRAKVIDSRGKLRSPEEAQADVLPALADRILGENRHRIFQLVSQVGTESRSISLTQRDIRELQLAKGAIRSGIEILMKELGVGPEDIKKVFLAGAFGNYIRAESALGIGLIPAFPNAEIIPVGNAAGSGAKMALLSRAVRAQATELLSRVEYLELSGRADFQQEFAEAMLFE